MKVGGTAMQQRIRSILANLEAVGEDLLALSDDIWLNIDHNDSRAVQRGAEFKVAFNEAVSEFNRSSTRLSQLVEDFTEVPTFEPPTAPQSAEERERRERIIRSLDQRVPHSLDEDFRYKRPVAFTLGGVPFDGTSTWSQVYETLCRHLSSINPSVFEALPNNSAFVSNRGNKYFSRDASDLRIHRDFGRGVLAETNLSANQIRDNIKRILQAFGLAEKEFAVYLREDRDASEEGAV
jgi:hypothetical protein